MNLEPGGTIYTATLDNQGTLNENGGTLVVAEPGAASGEALAMGVVAVFARRRERRR